MVLFSKKSADTDDPWSLEQEADAWEKITGSEELFCAGAEKNCPAGPRDGRFLCLLAAAVCCGMGFLSFRIEQAFGGLIELLDWLCWLGFAVSMLLLCFKKEEGSSAKKDPSPVLILLLATGLTAIVAAFLYFSPTALAAWQLAGLCFFLLLELLPFCKKKNVSADRRKEALTTLAMAVVSVGIIGLWFAVFRPASIQDATLTLQNAGCSRAVYKQSLSEDLHALLPLQDEPEHTRLLEEGDKGFGYYILETEQNNTRFAAVVSVRSGRLIGMSDSDDALLWIN